MFCEEDVCQNDQEQKSSKATGLCVWELVMTCLHTNPQQWKYPPASNTTIFIPKNPTRITRLNGYRPVSLTFEVMLDPPLVCLSRLIGQWLMQSTWDCIIVSNTAAIQRYAGIPFVDFSSAFNTINQDLLHTKLILLSVPTSNCQLTNPETATCEVGVIQSCNLHDQHRCLPGI